MNRVFVNTKAIEKKSHWADKKNTCFIVRGMRNVRLTCMRITFDERNMYILSKKGLAIINVKKCKNLLISHCNLQTECSHKSFYSLLKGSRRVYKRKTKCKK